MNHPFGVLGNMFELPWLLLHFFSDHPVVAGSLADRGSPSDCNMCLTCETHMDNYIVERNMCVRGVSAYCEFIRITRIVWPHIARTATALADADGVYGGGWSSCLCDLK